MHIPVLVIVPKEQADNRVRLKNAVGKVISDFANEAEQANGFNHIHTWSLGGRYAIDSGDAEPSAWAKWRYFESLPGSRSIFDHHLMSPVRNLTEEDVKQFSYRLLYRQGVEDGEKLMAARDDAEYLKSIVPDDIAVIVDVHSLLGEGHIPMIRQADEDEAAE